MRTLKALLLILLPVICAISSMLRLRNRVGFLSTPVQRLHPLGICLLEFVSGVLLQYGTLCISGGQ